MSLESIFQERKLPLDLSLWSTSWSSSGETLRQLPPISDPSSQCSVPIQELPHCLSRLSLQLPTKKGVSQPLSYKHPFAIKMEPSLFVPSWQHAHRRSSFLAHSLKFYLPWTLTLGPHQLLLLPSQISLCNLRDLSHHQSRSQPMVFNCKFGTLLLCRECSILEWKIHLRDPQDLETFSAGAQLILKQVLRLNQVIFQGFLRALRISKAKVQPLLLNFQLIKIVSQSFRT